MPLADPYQVHEITHLSRKPRAAEALELLRRVALQVQPIMRKRQLTVRKLSEFIPTSANLLGLNVNKGAEVKIRLRPPGQEDSFYSWNHLLGTMLHELCHNKVAPHNAAFYQLLDELWCEAEALMDRGITGIGQGFDAPAVGRLGAFSVIPTHNAPQHQMAVAVRKAAEARAQKAAIMPAGPQRLGGSRSYKHMTPAQAAAAAAERRAHDNRWCGAEHTPEEVQQELGSADAPPAASTLSGVAAASSAGLQRWGAAAVAGGALGAAMVASAASRHPDSRCGAATIDAAGHAALQQRAQQQVMLQAKLQHQQTLQQQAQQHKGRKRTAAQVIDLTLSDDDSEGLPDVWVVRAAAAHCDAAVAQTCCEGHTCSSPCCRPESAATDRPTAAGSQVGV